MIKRIKLLLLFLVTVIQVSIASADYGNCPRRGMMYGLYGGYGAGAMFLGWVSYLLIIALIIAAIYWFIKSANKQSEHKIIKKR